MRNDKTFSIPSLNPIDTSACIMIQLYYMMENKSSLDFFISADKLIKMELKDRRNPQAEPDLSLCDTLFQGVIFCLLISILDFKT